MARDLRYNLGQELVVPLLFGDVLGEEFRPATDPNRLHDLGRIASAAFNDGEQAVQNVITREVRWSPGVSSMIIVKPVSLEVVSLTGVTLSSGKHGEGASNHLTAMLGESDPASKVIQLNLTLNGNADPHEFPLDLGPGIRAARAKTRELAERFFETAKIMDIGPAPTGSSPG